MNSPAINREKLLYIHMVLYLTVKAYTNTLPMQSKIHIKGHPLHPILIAFPVAFFTGTLLFDIWGIAASHASYMATAYHLEVLGIVTGLIAAIPGIIDYFGVVPPGSSAKKRASSHGLLNLSMIVLFAIACLARKSNPEGVAVYLALEAAGFVLLAIAGWMGGTLVYRNQIGVNNLYADAGKWKEEQFNTVEQQLKVATTAELKTNQLKLLIVNGKRIVLGKTEEGYVAFEDQCPHKGGSLADGAMMCGTIQCPWHGSQFNVHTGTATAGPAKKGIHTYPVTEKEGNVFVTVK